VTIKPFANVGKRVVVGEFEQRLIFQGEHSDSSEGISPNFFHIFSSNFQSVSAFDEKVANCAYQTIILKAVFFA
jgi:hypothetical protein